LVVEVVIARRSARPAFPRLSSVRVPLSPQRACPCQTCSQKEPRTRSSDRDERSARRTGGGDGRPATAITRVIVTAGEDGGVGSLQNRANTSYAEETEECRSGR
jgi:hypothetical protein